MCPISNARIHINAYTLSSRILLALIYCFVTIEFISLVCFVCEQYARFQVKRQQLIQFCVGTYINLGLFFFHIFEYLINL